MALGTKKKKKNDEKAVNEENRTISDKGAKESVVVNESMTRKAGEPLSVWKKRTGIDKEEAKQVKAKAKEDAKALAKLQQERLAKNEKARKANQPKPAKK